MTHQLGHGTLPGYVDKRRTHLSDFENRIVTTGAQFTANAGGTTTTLVGADATLATGVNVMRVGDEFKLFNSAGAVKQETVFRVTSVASSAGTTTVTFTPAASGATASGDNARLVGYYNTQSTGDKDRRLAALGFSTARIATMTENDKDFQIRVSDDPGSL